MTMSLRGTRSLPGRIGRAVLGPVGFALGSGYFRSCLRGHAVDRNGDPIPMYTYPAVDLLVASRAWFRTRSVLEFGSGQSTRWWARHARRVVAVEYDAAFASRLRALLHSAPNVELVLGDDYLALPAERFDVVSIDGYPRVAAARFVLDRVAEDGIIIVDNSDVRSLAELCDVLAGAGSGRIDFFGHSPAAYYKQCTSIFFRDPGFFSWSRAVAPVSPRSFSERLV